MAENWQYTRLLSMGLNYQVVDDTVYVEGFPVGQVQYLASLDSRVMNSYVKIQLDTAKLSDKQEKEHIKVADLEAVERRAQRDGEMVADFLLDIAPSVVNSRSLWWVIARIGKALGYVDTDANDAFKFAVMDKFDSYKRANPVNSIAQRKQRDTLALNTTVESD